ncbi:MAG: GntR family transcriptional regulator [Planctomycetes bacterium]|nr:GntR family transcriptional regulator [Planctomycetota bacterium]
MRAIRSKSSLRCDHGQRRQRIVESLLAEVFLGRLKAGQHLVTQELAERFGVSHTPVREALISLAGIGVVDLLPNRGAVVRSITPRGAREICQVRRALECEAVRRACGRIDPADLRAISTEIRGLVAARRPFPGRVVEKARSLDSRLHDLIAGSCGNAFLASELERLKILFRAFRDAAWEHDGALNGFARVAEEAREHLAIVDALSEGDRRQASRVMSRHILAGARYWSRVLRGGARTSAAPENGHGKLNGRNPSR